MGAAVVAQVIGGAAVVLTGPAPIVTAVARCFHAALKRAPMKVASIAPDAGADAVGTKAAMVPEILTSRPARTRTPAPHLSEVGVLVIAVVVTDLARV